MAYTFNRSNAEYLERTGAISFAPPFTVQAWYYPVDGTDSIITSARSSTAGSYFQLFLSGSKLILGARGETSGIQNCTTANTFTLNTWHHCIAGASDLSNRFVRLAGGARVNGVVVAVDTVSSNFDLFSVGRGALLTGANGLIAEVAYWNVALTDDEQLALSKGFSPLLVRPHALLFYWPLRRSDRVGSTHLDRWRSGINLTESAALALADPPRIIVPDRPRLGGLEYPPATPVNTLPGDGATVSVTQLLTWAPAPAATSYDVYFGTTPSPPLVSSAQVETSYLAMVTPGTPYYWQVRSRNGGGVTTGPVWTFTLAGSSGGGGTHAYASA